MAPRFVCAVGLVLLAAANFIATPSRSQSDRPGDLLRGLVGGTAPRSAEELESEAAAESDLVAARRLYETLHSRYPDREAGARAALWLGRYHYGMGAVEEGLRYFEAARSSAAESDLRAEATFWCEQARLLAGREPLGPGDDGSAKGYWETLRSLCRVDRLVRQGRSDEAETRLRNLEEAGRSLGLCGLLLVRWGDVLRLLGGGPSEIEYLQPLVRMTCGLPERLHLERPLTVTGEVGEAGESWALEFGSHVDPQEAHSQQDTLRTLGLETRIDETLQGDRTIYQVRLGDFSSRAEIDSFSSHVISDAAVRPRIVRLR